ncbi:MAG: flavohemoglobin expression-modulating QEGLA motif protein [Longimicrobiales bacterium]
MIDEILERLQSQESVRRSLSAGGVLSIDRGLPYLIVYREPPDRPDRGTARLVSGEAAYLISRAQEAAEVYTLVGALAQAGSIAHGAFLVLEIWSSADPQSGRFIVRAPEGPAPETVGKLADALEALSDLWPELEVVREITDERHPPGLAPLLSVEESWRTEVLLLGLEVPPIYRDPETGDVYPRFLRRVQHSFSRALRQALYEFVRVQTSSKVENHLALGTRTLPDAVWEVDRSLYAIEHSVDLLLLTSPVNSDEAWERFRADGFDQNPEFHYRLLRVDPDLLKRRLFSIEIETIDDPAMADLFEDKRQELDTQFSMLRERGAPSFRYSGQRLYGAVDDLLHQVAEGLLASVRTPPKERGEWVDANGFREAAEEELAYYSRHYPAIDNRIEVRRDIIGLMVSEGNLMIGEDLKLRPERVVPLLHHEVGTHVLTYVNGRAQPLQQLSLGLAGYDELQEGLAVLAEYLAGGLDSLRMRLLAARVIAARSVEDGAEFVETFRLLHREYGYSAGGAWHIAMRVHRCGGFTRDLIYLRGLVNLLKYLEHGGELAPLYAGKLALKHVPVIEELQYRGVLSDPPLLPRVLESPEARDRLDTVRRGISLAELICPETA